MLPTVSGSVKVYGYDESDHKKDSCTCFSERGFVSSDLVYAWRGPDCSQKTCPYAPAHGAHKRRTGEFALQEVEVETGKDHKVVHDALLECSGVGTCDESNGKCICPPGYTGEACQRTSCPNDCSGFGVCTTLYDYVDQIVKDNDANYYVDFSSAAYNGFDKSASRGCVCDKGRRGPDCSIKECPSGSDIMGGHGASKGRTCSGRGKCVDGICKCFEGFKGNMCQSQSASNTQ